MRDAVREQAGVRLRAGLPCFQSVYQAVEEFARGVGVCAVEEKLEQDGLIFRVDAQEECRPRLSAMVLASLGRQSQDSHLF